MSNELTTIIRDDNFLAPAVSLETALQVYQSKKEFIEKILKDGVDFGTIPGTSSRKCLLKPGAEKMTSFFGLAPKFEDVQTTEDWTGRDHNGEPFFYYRIKCILSNRHGNVMGEADGSCSSWETKYRYRWVKAEDLPNDIDKSMLVSRSGAISEFAFAIDKQETSGTYGKPAEYWQKFLDAIMAGTAVRSERPTKNGKLLPAWTIDTTLYRIANADTAEQVNTVLKMAQKRALIAATLIVTGLSDHFTQDVLDDYSDTTYEPPHTVYAKSTPVPETPKPNWFKAIQSAATMEAIKDITRHAAEADGYLADELVMAAQKREAELKPKPAKESRQATGGAAAEANTAQSQDAPPAADKKKLTARDWEEWTPGQRTSYTINKANDAAKLEPQAGLETLATIQRKISEAALGAIGYKAALTAINEIERQLMQKQAQAAKAVEATSEPAAETSEDDEGVLDYLQAELAQATPERREELARAWEQDKANLSPAAFAAGQKMIADRKEAK
jgi:hypothetical protein